MTIAQPTEKRGVAKDWADKTMARIAADFKVPQQNTLPIASFMVDCVYWIRRTDTTPFHIEQAFPLGVRYPPIYIGLNLSRQQADETLIKFMSDKQLISTTGEQEFEKICDRCVNSVTDSVRRLLPLDAHTTLESKLTNKNPQMRFQFRDSNGSYLSLQTCGSYLLGIKCSDLDLAIVRQQQRHSTTGREQFATDLAYELSQNDELFHVVRNISDANIPIIELCLRSSSSSDVATMMGLCESADVQIHDLELDIMEDETLFYDSFGFMKRMEAQLANDYARLAAISGLFENQNLKKYIRNYKVNFLFFN